MVSWQIKKITNAKTEKNGYGLYAIRPQIIGAPVTIPARSAPAADEIYQLNDVVDSPIKHRIWLQMRCLLMNPNAPGVPDDLSLAAELESLSSVSPKK